MRVFLGGQIHLFSAFRETFPPPMIQPASMLQLQPTHNFGPCGNIHGPKAFGFIFTTMAALFEE